MSCDEDKQLHELYSTSKDELISDHLISVNDSYDLMNSDESKFRVIHIGKKEGYLKEHIPGAFQFWRPDYSSTQKDSIQGMIAKFDQVQEILRRISYDPGSILLIYGTKANVDAMRFSWVLELYGITNFKIINGGLKYWKLNELAVSSGEEQHPEPNEYLLNKEMKMESYASFEDVKKAIEDKEYLIVDTREEYEFRGEPFILNNTLYKYKSKAFDRGKIPGSIRLNWSQLVDLNGDHRIKSAKDIYYDLEQRGISKDKKIILYCQSGSRSSNTYFILNHILEFPNVKNYDGSWIEWSYNHSKDPNIKIDQLCSQDSFDILYAHLEQELQ